MIESEGESSPESYAKLKQQLKELAEKHGAAIVDLTSARICVSAMDRKLSRMKLKCREANAVMARQKQHLRDKHQDCEMLKNALLNIAGKPDSEITTYVNDVLEAIKSHNQEMPF